MKIKILIVIVTVIFCMPFITEAAKKKTPKKAFHAMVVKIIDGDTIDVRLKNGTVERIRVYGMNTPERWEPCFKQAKKFTSDMVSQKDVKILTRGRGKYKRLLGFVIINGKSLGLELVKHGHARVYSNQFAPSNLDTYQRYQKAQIHAMSGDLGIWGNACKKEG